MIWCIMFVLASGAGGILGSVGCVVACFVAAQFESDKTVGGAYVALAMLLAPIFAVVGCIVGGVTFIYMGGSGG